MPLQGFPAYAPPRAAEEGLQAALRKRVLAAHGVGREDEAEGAEGEADSGGLTGSRLLAALADDVGPRWLA